MSSMMLTVSSLSLVGQVLTNVFSPSRNPCMRRVAPMRYRNDPYNAPVLATHAATPVNYSNDLLATCMTPSAFNSLHTQQPQSIDELLTSMSQAQPTAVARTIGSYTSSQQTFMKVPVAPAAVSCAPPAAPATRYAFVRFKHESVTFVAPFRIATGDIVVVEGDRGENIGTVEGITTEKPTYDVKNVVLRRATPQDKDALDAQRKKEDAAIRTIQQLSDSLGLRASIEDAEFQFDLNKLTVFVRRNCKNAFVDFRKLQRSLFREFRCRIWCAYMDEVEEADKAPRFQ